MNPRKDSLAEGKRRDFAILCREVRLWIHKNPGIAEYELCQKFGKKADFALGRMLGMGIVRSEQVLSDNGRVKGWFVVPQ